MNQTLVNQPQSTTQGPTGSPRLLARLSTRILAWFEVPEGYQDENGFHFGPQPTPQFQTTSAVMTDRADQAFIYASANAPQAATPSSTATVRA